jgi:hypothetical protein
VTPVGWVYPYGPDGALASLRDQAIVDACAAGRSSLHGTGIHPGGITERFPLMVSGLVSGVSHVRAEEFSDIRSYATEFVVREIMMFGKAPDDASAGPMADLLAEHFGQSVAMLAAVLGWDLDPGLRSEHSSAVATEPIETPVGTIERGTVAAQRFVWTATVGGAPVITVAVNWLMGEQHLDPPWTFGGPQRFEVAVDGTPPLLVTFRGLQPDPPESGIEHNPGIAATAMHCVNAIPYVCAAEPGITTYLDLPLIAGRRAQGAPASAGTVGR